MEVFCTAGSNDDEEEDEEVRGVEVTGVRVEAGTTAVADEEEEEEEEEEEDEGASVEAGTVTALFSDVADSIKPSGRANRMHTM